MDNWTRAKQTGSDHYRLGDVQPIDLYRAAGAFVPFALCSIIKYAYRCLTRGVNPDDLKKIRHYAQLIRSDQLDNEKTEQATGEVPGKPDVVTNQPNIDTSGGYVYGGDTGIRAPGASGHAGTNQFQGVKE